jgi:diguanylate cyclase (GGDEF)-like protein
MTTFSESNSSLSSPFGRALVVQSGIEKTNTIDLMREVDSNSIEIADDIYEAITRVGLAEANTPIRTVCIPLMIPDYSPERVVQAFRRMNGKIKLVLIVPSGRNEAGSAALKAGFDNILEIPASANSIANVLNGNTSLADTAAREVAPPATHPVEMESPTPTTDANRATPPIDDADLGDIDLVESVLRGEGELLDTAIRMMRIHLGTDDVHLVLPEDSWVSDGRSESPVLREDRIHGTLVSATISIEDLDRWSEWLSRWMDLEWHMGNLAHLAETDQLTGAGNRRAFERILQETIENARNERQLATLMVFDIDNFKTYNDQFGHDAGDEVLRETVQLLTSTIRRGDHVFRIGGDEFVVIFGHNEGPRGEGSAPPESVEQIAHRFQDQVCKLRFPQLGMEAAGTLTISAGLATFPWDGHDAHSLLRHADQLAIESKRAGKNLITFGPGAAKRCRDT